MEHTALIEEFSGVFKEGSEDVRVFFSPGRINLIGEHTDYNGGNVLPCAITIGTYGAARKRGDRMVRLYSKNFSDAGIIEFSLDELVFKKEHSWANYPKGMLHFLQNSGHLLSGMDLYISGNIPNGAGLSSSASLELLTGVIAEELFQLTIDRIDLVQLGKKTENEFIGVNCGIMDQFAIGMGKKDTAILLDCNTLAYEYAPIEMTGCQIVIMNTNKRRELAESKYNIRRNECETALTCLQKELSVQALGELTEEQFEEHRHLIPDETVYRRARHAVYENQRTIKAISSLRNGSIEEFGELMNQSHLSLRDDYEVTGLELDAIVEAAWQHPGTLGARMTGAGFGGCAIALVKKEHLDSFIEETGRKYREASGYEADFYMASTGDGTKEVTAAIC
ncbi:galactokinase [Metabacillus sp. GX 13764]|nr:galactokinase [Metabacillus kandeliae]MCD7035393.1 galactokinase [Metabacillus kandeliae]